MNLSTAEGPKSDMGNFGRLPGELRNKIYRLVAVKPQNAQPTLATACKKTCVNGACTHTTLDGVAPALANTCRQIQHEMLPIFLKENTFKFPDFMVSQRCVAHWIAALGPFARHLGVFILEMRVLVRATLIAPAQDSMAEIRVHENYSNDNISTLYVTFLDDKGQALLEQNAQEELDAWVSDINQTIRAPGEKTLYLLRSDTLANVVFLYCNPSSLERRRLLVDEDDVLGGARKKARKELVSLAAQLGFHMGVDERRV